MVEIQFCHKEQLGIIGKLAYEIWPLVYDYMISKDQIAFMLNLMYSPGALEKQWEEGHLFIVIQEKGGDPFGFASFQTTPEGYAKLHKLYLPKNQHGKGYGRRILSFIIHQCQDKKQVELALNVNRNNKALAFYLSNGFSIKESVDVAIGNGYEMNDYIMVKSIL